MMKNAMSSLNEAGLLMEPELEVEGRDRLVKVAHLDKLKILTDEIG
jgi:glycerone phosphate O-acyltransferase